MGLGIAPLFLFVNMKYRSEHRSYRNRCGKYTPSSSQTHARELKSEEMWKWITGERSIPGSGKGAFPKSDTQGRAGWPGGGGRRKINVTQITLLHFLKFEAIGKTLKQCLTKYKN